MASRIKAINQYRPRIVLGKRVEMDEQVAFMARSTGLNEGTIRQVLIELRDTVVFFNHSGRPVKLDGLGTYTPTVGLDGSFDIGHRADNYLKNALNTPGAFGGEIENRTNIGKSGDELAALWNEEYPDDPVV